MASATPTIGNHILQSSLTDMHRKSLDWLSATVLWKREVAFFQKLLDKYAPKYSAINDKKQLDHFQSLITYYSGELIDELRKKLREHESRLARMLTATNESDAPFVKEHQELMEELSFFSERFMSVKHELFDFVETAM